MFGLVIFNVMKEFLQIVLAAILCAAVMFGMFFLFIYCGKPL